MANSKAKKITLEDFINKATNKYKNRKMSVDIPVDGFGELTFNRPSDNDLLEYLNNVAKGVKADKDGNILDTDLTVMVEASQVLVYKTCDYLHNKELQENLEIVDPLDTPIRVFGATRTMEIAEKISNAFENDGIKETVKN